MNTIKVLERAAIDAHLDALDDHLDGVVGSRLHILDGILDDDLLHTQTAKSP